jgi:hypothetical protein
MRASRSASRSQNLCEYGAARSSGYFRRDAVYMLIVILGDYRLFVYAITCRENGARAPVQNQPVT